jgi:hypothetical protein
MRQESNVAMMPRASCDIDMGAEDGGTRDLIYSL